MDGGEFFKFRQTLKLTRADLSKKLGLSENQLYRYEHNLSPIPRTVHFALIAIYHRLDDKDYIAVDYGVQQPEKKKKLTAKKLPKEYKDEWPILRDKVFDIYGKQCMSCGEEYSDLYKIHVDHIKPKSKYPHLSLDIKNLQVLCYQCNFKKNTLNNNDYRTTYHLAALNEYLSTLDDDS